MERVKKASIALYSSENAKGIDGSLTRTSQPNSDVQSRHLVVCFEYSGKPKNIVESLKNRVPQKHINSSTGDSVSTNPALTSQHVQLFG